MRCLAGKANSQVWVFFHLWVSRHIIFFSAGTARAESVFWSKDGLAEVGDPCEEPSIHVNEYAGRWSSSPQSPHDPKFHKPKTNAKLQRLLNF